jgi:fumarate reductase subunit C
LGKLPLSKKAIISPATMDVLQSLTGLILVAFVWAHMFFESSILLGKDAMYWVSRMFEGEHLFGKPYPLLVSAVAAIIFLLIALHAILAMRKFPGTTRQYTAFHRHMGTLRHSDTTLWYVQVITGFSLFFLVSAHLYIVFTQPENIGPYASADRIWSQRFWILYALLLVAMHVHAGIGIYRLAIKWAPLSSGNFQVLRVRLKIAICCIIVFFITLGTVTLVTYMNIGFDHAERAGERFVPATENQQTGH